MKLFTKYSLLSLVAYGLASCQKDEATPRHDNIAQNEPKIDFTILGDFTTPEIIDLDSPSEHRAFVLRPNERNYPKVVLTDLETASNSFQPYFSSVWVFDGNGNNDWRQIYVEDNGVKGAQEGSYQLGNNASSSRTPSAQKGVSRLLRHGNGYQFIVRFSAPSRGINRNNAWYDNYTQGKNYSMSVAISPNTNGGIGAPSQSVHRVYAPVLTHTDAGNRSDRNPMIPQLPPLKLIVGDYVLAEPSSTVQLATMSNPSSARILKVPVISDYLELGKINKNDHASLKTTFRMKGVLLSLKLSNKTGRNITVKRLRTRSNNIGYSGFYEMWKNGQSGGVIPQKTPLFSRASTHKQILQNAIYSFNLQNTDGTANIPLNSDSETTGRLYLWGGIDTYQPPTPSTKCQIIYEYTDDPGVEHISETIELSPQTGDRKFKEGTVYLITVPISKPLSSGSFAYNDFDRRTDDWQ